MHDYDFPVWKTIAGDLVSQNESTEWFHFLEDPKSNSPSCAGLKAGDEVPYGELMQLKHKDGCRSKYLCIPDAGSCDWCGSDETLIYQPANELAKAQDKCCADLIYAEVCRRIQEEEGTWDS